MISGQIREQQLRQEIKQLRVEIDHAKREREVKQITEADSFKTLRAEAEKIRRRRQSRDKKDDDETAQ